MVGIELRLRHRDGTWRHVLVSASPLRGESNEIIGRLDLIHDVTAERENQRVKDDFVKAASHELRTPITTIKGMTDFLLRTVEKHGSIKPAHLTQRRETIRHEADRLVWLGNDLLDLSRVQAGELLIDRTPVTCMSWWKPVFRASAMRSTPPTSTLLLS